MPWPSASLHPFIRCQEHSIAKRAWRCGIVFFNEYCLCDKIWSLSECCVTDLLTKVMSFSFQKFYFEKFVIKSTVTYISLAENNILSHFSTSEEKLKSHYCLHNNYHCDLANKLPQSPPSFPSLFPLFCSLSLPFIFLVDYVYFLLNTFRGQIPTWLFFPDPPHAECWICGFKYSSKRFESLL